MPPAPRMEYVDQPFAGRRHTPDTSRLSSLISRGGEQLAELALQRGQQKAQLFERLSSIFSGYQELERGKKATAAAMSLRASERAEDRGEKEKDRTERSDERKESQRLSRETQDRAAAGRLVDDIAPGPVADTPESAAMMGLINRFPETASRFRRTTTLPATPLGMGTMAPPQEMLIREPTGVEMRQSALDTRQREQDALAVKDRELANAARGRDDVRADKSLAATIENQGVMRQIAQQNANRDRSGADVVVDTADGPLLVDKSTGRTKPITGPDGQPVKAAPSAMERMDSRKFSKAAPVLKGIGELSERINTLQGVIAKASGEAEKVKARVNLNDDVAEYTALVSGFTPMIARALGHTGVLTQQDVDSVKDLFPRPGDSKTLRDRKINRMMSIIGELEGVEGLTKTPAANADPLGIRKP